MKILLVTPPQPGIKKAGNSKILRGLLPPLGMGYVAAVLEKEGHSVKIIDSPVLAYEIKDIIESASIFKPEILGISTLSPLAEEAYKLSKAFKRCFPLTKIVLGGAHPTCFPEEAINAAPEIDIIVIGEGEYIMLDVVRALSNGKEELSGVKGIYYRDKNNQIVKNQKRDEVIDLKDLPFPSRHLYSILRYAPEPFENRMLPSTNLIASRGCTYARCTFCYRSGRMKREYRVQPVQKTIEEIRSLVKKYRIKELIFYDDDLLSNKKWVMDFCDALLKEPYRLQWSFRGRCDTASYEVLKAAKEAGCWSVSYGFESGNQDLLDNIKKGITLEQSRKVSEWAHKLDLELVGTFMLGLPGETPEKGEKTIDFAIELDCTYAAFIPTHPFVGTELYEYAVKKGKFVDMPYSGRMLATRFMPKISYVPDGYRGVKAIEELCKKAYRKFYLRPCYILKHLRKIKNINDVRRYYEGIKFMFGLC
ncbi:MAG: radical SAM protein [Candidatus Omnitrophica bacterium]|nr:radical SAM protein [Candidatus Omnitrophota bacterium]